VKSEGVGTGVVVDDVELGVLPQSAEAECMPAFDPIQRGVELPFILIHAGISETGARAKFEALCNCRIVTCYFDLRNVLSQKADTELARSEILSCGRISHQRMKPLAAST